MQLPMKEIFGDLVLLKLPEEQKMTESGILFADTVSMEYPDTAEVVLLPSAKHKTLPYPADHLTIGDIVLFNKYAGEFLQTKDEMGKVTGSFRLLPFDSIFSIIKL